MKKLLTCATALLYLIVSGYAQQSSGSSQRSSSTSTTTETMASQGSSTWGNYLGLRGGYLFTNKKVHDNATWYLKDGQFAELNFGSRKGFLGFGGALGYYTIKRNPAQWATVYGSSQNVYDNVTTNIPVKPLVPAGILGENDLAFTDHATDLSKNLRGFYLMAGPEFWVGSNKLQGHLYLQGGVGYTRFGYYYVDGSISNLAGNPFTAGANTYQPTYFDFDYYQYGMTQKHLAASILGGTVAVKEKYDAHFMGRAGASLEYFVSPKISVHGGASLWYIANPKMDAEKNVQGQVTYQRTAPLPPVATKHSFDYTDKLPSERLLYASANVGIKFWMFSNRSSYRKTTKTVTTTNSSNSSYSAQAAPKEIMVQVKDKLTGLALSGVKVDIIKDGALYTTVITDANGMIPVQAGVTPANYEIKGEKNGVKATTAIINAADFQSAAKTIMRELIHDDRRFTLVGFTIDRKTNSKMGAINTILTNKDMSSNQNQTSDGLGKFIYQLDQNTDYSVMANNKGFYSNMESVTTKGLDRSKTLYVDLLLGVDELKTGNSFTVKNILYDFDKSNIRPDAEIILNTLVQMMNDNPQIRIELSSHTDSRGSAEHNLSLSQARAQSAKNYLVSKGIDASRIIAVGYGEAKLLNGCVDGTSCSEAQHQENRRTEVKVL